jgi:osmotically-inducible protein OsmY
MLALALSAACNRGPDPKAQVEDQLKSANIENVNVDYDSSANVLHLKGEVDSATEASRAEQIANQAVGTSGRVANELTVKGRNSSMADDMDGSIRSELNAKVDNDRMLNERDINFDVNNGVVTIKGKVGSASEKEQVAQMARGTQNVKDVVNALEIDADMMRDTTMPRTPASDRDRNSEPAPRPVR